ncbi:hypothetical protein [Nodosilinea sp. FACHB-13]|uniref:hypothetical protein n=2 Tax=Cyanophyceae TaxID=3028117 RepID=UPI001A7E97D4|nr:hypothetical protein [Nodosilinea sp. FACHB-13]
MAHVQPENFEPEVRHLFGDLRLKHTWEKAYSHFFVGWLIACIFDGDTYFKVLDPSKWSDWKYELRFLTLEALAAHPEFKSLTSNSYSYLVSTNQEELARGLLELAREAIERQQQYSTDSTVVMPRTESQSDQGA